MTDAASSAGNAAAREVPSAPIDSGSPARRRDKAGDAAKVDTKSEAARGFEVLERRPPGPPRRHPPRTDRLKPSRWKNASAENSRPAATDTANKATPNEVAAAAPASVDAPKVEGRRRNRKGGRQGRADQPEAKTEDVKAEDVKAEPAKPEMAKAIAKPDESLTAATDALPSAVDVKAVDVKKDQTRLPTTTSRRLQNPNRLSSRRQSAPARSRCLSAARIPSSMCGRISHRCSTCP